MYLRNMPMPLQGQQVDIALALTAGQMGNVQSIGGQFIDTVFESQAGKAANPIGYLIGSPISADEFPEGSAERDKAKHHFALTFVRIEHVITMSWLALDFTPPAQQEKE